MGNAGLDEVQAGIKIAGRNINNLRYVDDIILMSESKEELAIKLPTSDGSQKKEERSKGTSTSALMTMPNPLTVWITRNCGKF